VPEPSPTSDLVEETLLLQVLDGDGYGVGNVVIGVEATQRDSFTTMLAVPASLLVPQGDDSVTLGSTPDATDTLAGVRAIEEGLGIRIDAGLTLDRLAFAGLVDAVGGIWVELDRPILLPAIGDDNRRRVLGPGRVNMDGIAAADYAVLRLPGESEQDQIDRFLGVLTQALVRLPSADDQMRQLLTSLGSLAASTVPTEDLVPFLMAVRADIASARMAQWTLPVEVIRGGSRPASVAAPDAEPLVRKLFPDARVEPEPAGMTG
jgi:anionic cell wall polymer biosynthesis LytR-Cps2A-Psr (LCP) family protein